jgi:SAM-dependent methyltransferase/SOS-response transcriptional repressor LexA
MIAGKPAPEISVDKIMREIREAAPRRDNLGGPATSIRMLTLGASLDLEDVAVELGRSAPGVDPPAPIHLSLSDSDWQPMPTPLLGREEAAYHFRDFLAYDDVDFVRAAYQAILKRDADEEGLRCYLAMLQDGASKAEILHRICESPEGRRKNVRIGGLRLPYALDSISRLPFIGRAIAIAVAIWNLPGSERSHRRESRELARRLRQNEQHSLRNAKTATDAFRRLEHSQNVLADMTKLFATRAQSESFQKALTRTIASLQSLQKATKTHVDKGLFDAQIDELRANIETKAESTAVETTHRQIQRISETKADRRDSERWAKDVGASIRTIAEAKADTAELAQVQTAIKDARRQIQHISETKANRGDSERWAKDVGVSIRTIAEAKADTAELAQVQTAIEDVAQKLELIRESKASSVDLQNLEVFLLSATEAKAERHEITALTNHLVALLEHRATKTEFEFVRSSIERTNDAIGNIRRDKANISDLDGLGVEIKRESRIALEEVERVVQDLNNTKADQATISALRLELNAAAEDSSTSRGALQDSINEWDRKLDSLSQSKADQAAIAVLRSEVIAALENYSGAVKVTLGDSIAEMDRKLDSLEQSKADQAAIAAVRLELSAAVEDSSTARGALQGSIKEWDRKLDSLSQAKADQAAITVLRSEMIAALENYSGAAKVTLGDSLAEMDRKLDSLEQSKADQAAIAAVRLELNAAVDDSSTARGALQGSIKEWDRKLDSLSQSKADQAAITVLRSEMIAALENYSGAAKVTLGDSLAEVDCKLDSIEQASRKWMNRLDEVVAKKADNAVVEAVKAEANIAITLNQKSAVDALTSALAVVNSQAHDLKINVLDQGRRVGLLLEEARKRFPKPISGAQIGTMLSEDDHRLDAMYASFEDQFRGTRADIRRRQAIYLPYVREAKAGTANAPVIDVGCGRGEWLELLRDEGFVARGVDLNRIFLDGCRDLKLDVSEQDALSFLRELKRDSVGVLTSFHMIEHLDHKILIALLDETLRVLRPGGVAIFETPNPRNVVVGSCNFYLDPTHKRPLPPDLSRYLLEARGFSKVEVQDLHPCGEEQMVSEGAQKVRDVLNHMLYSAQDYAVIGRKV